MRPDFAAQNGPFSLLSDAAPERANREMDIHCDSADDALHKPHSRTQPNPSLPHIAETPGDISGAFDPDLASSRFFDAFEKNQGAVARARYRAVKAAGLPGRGLVPWCN